MIQVSASELAALHAAKAERLEQQQVVGLLTEQVALLREQLDWCKRQIFGQKSERFIELPSQLPDLPGLQMPEAAAPSTLPVEVPKHTRGKKPRKGSCTLVIPDELERVERLIDVPEAERTLADGTPLVRIGEDVHEQLAHRPGEYYVLRTVRPKYGVAKQPHLGIVQESAPAGIMAGTKFATSFMANLVVEKFVYHLPLYRLEEKLAGRGIQVTRQLLSQTLKTLGQRISPIVQLMSQRLLSSGTLFVDETTVKMQAPGKCRECRIWVYVNGQPNAPPYHLYQFTLTREHHHVTDFLKHFSGNIHADAYGAYETLDQDPTIPIRWAACWAHARRKFHDAKSGSESLRRWVLRHMRYLFLFERIAWARDAQERLRIRQEKERPLVDAILAKLKDALTTGQILPKSKMGQAISYMLARPDNFKLYLDDANLRMDNNAAERALRKLTIGRKNWMFVGSQAAGDAMVNLLSLVQTCRAMAINPQLYLEDLFERLLDHPAKQLQDFLPDIWKQNRLEQKESPD